MLFLVPGGLLGEFVFMPSTTNSFVYCRGGKVFLGPSFMSESSVGKSVMDCWVLCGCTGEQNKQIIEIINSAEVKSNANAGLLH